jgi:hypothetical protein
MCKTPYYKILSIIDSILSKTESHVNNLVLVVNENFHLMRMENSTNASTAIEFLNNLSGDPNKAFEILKKMKSILQKWGEVEVLRDEDKVFYFELMYDGVVNNFKTDPAALLYLDVLLIEVSSMTEGDS